MSDAIPGKSKRAMRQHQLKIRLWAFRFCPRQIHGKAQMKNPAAYRSGVLQASGQISGIKPNFNAE
jgi:hypothetical protein